MAVIKCKMCGGDMEISADKTFGTCEYCGSTMTLPKVSDDQRAAAFNRGNHFRRAGEFDKALGVYERIVAEDDTDAEAHCAARCAASASNTLKIRQHTNGCRPATAPASTASLRMWITSPHWSTPTASPAASTRRTQRKLPRYSVAYLRPRRTPSPTTCSSATKSSTKTANAHATVCLRRTSTISSPSRGGACSSRVSRLRTSPVHSTSRTYSPR